jgi:hypothetical protein
MYPERRDDLAMRRAMPELLWWAGSGENGGCQVWLFAGNAVFGYDQKLKRNRTHNAAVIPVGPITLLGVTWRAMSVIEKLAGAAEELGSHPQDHGWRDLYRLLAHALQDGGVRLQRILLDYCGERSSSSDSHTITVLGIAIKVVAADSFDQLLSNGCSLERRLVLLEGLVTNHADEIVAILRNRRNSFTGVRRFLVTQTILGAYFARRDEYEVNLADLGTGLGILPRQLNSRSQYEKFRGDLLWPDGVPKFRSIPLVSVFGVDMSPMPSLEWVQACYGASGYYSRLYDELISILDMPDIRNAAVQYRDLNLLDLDSLAGFIREHEINVVNLCYVLYELEREKRNGIIELLKSELRPPAVIMITEPRAELTRQGCVVTVSDEESSSFRNICAVSDGHFRGRVFPLDDYESFVQQFPILY